MQIKSLKIALAVIILITSSFLPWAGTSQVKVARAASAGPQNCGTGANDTAIGSRAWTNPGNGCANGQSTTASNVTASAASNYLKTTNFGFSIPASAKILGIQVTVSRSSTANKGNRATDNAVRIVKGGVIGSTDKSSATQWSTTPITYGTTSDLWGETWAASDINASNFGVAISAKSTGSNAIAATISSYVTIAVTYNMPPSAPTQNSPANAATGVSTTPTFTMTTTDSDSDNLGYKVTIYSDSGCSSVVQTNDQSSSSTGWTGTDATCTANPTSCYASGTQASFLTQSALSGGTQYWWKASAKDPDGSGSFTDSSICNSFTTVAAISISMTTDGSVSFGSRALNSAVDTTASGINDVETISVDSGPANLNIKSSNFTEGGNNWTLGAANGVGQVKWEFSKDGSNWSTFTSPDPTTFTFDTNVAQSATRSLYFRLTLPTETSSYNQYSSNVTIVASAP